MRGQNGLPEDRIVRRAMLPPAVGTITAPAAEKRFDAALARHADAVIDDALVLLAVPSSVADPDGPAQALAAYLALGRRLGLRTADLDGRAGYVEFGDGDGYVAVLGHVDTVPPGPGWTRSPWGEVVEGRMYGRGAVDDKGPMVTALHALAAIRDADIVLERRARIVVGTDEETSGDSIGRYRSREPDPVAGFSPDAVFPVVHAEKGLLWSEWRRRLGPPDGPVRVVSATGGDAPNMVPDRATAVLHVDEPGTTARLLREEGCLAEIDGATVRVTAFGAASHGSRPELGVNAIGRLLAAIDRAGPGGDVGAVIGFLNATLGRAPGGGAIDLPAPDVTVNIGLLALDGGCVRLVLDIRYPAPLALGEVEAAVERAAAEGGFETGRLTAADPLWADPSGSLVASLLEVYRAETGDLAANPVSIAGTTYAKAMPRTVAFGPRMPETPDLTHAPDEAIDVDGLAALVRIYARAIRALAALPP